MSRTLEEVRQIALELPEDDRRQLANSLWETLTPSDEVTESEIDAAWGPEIARRVAEIKAGTAITYSLEEVEADLRAIVGK
jgi:putative addiction module component (TIGR02574 family)